MLTNYTLSQCSTVVRNTVVTATIKVNGKPQILGTRNPLTLCTIDLKFDMGDYVGDIEKNTKNCKNRYNRVGSVDPTGRAQ